jgi:RNA polymerase sigma factor (sigma-70 family)
MKEMIEKYYGEQYKTLVKRFTNRAGSVWNAEDVVSEGFARALTYADSYNPDKKELGAWINTIMNNSLKNFKHADRLMGMSVEFDELKNEGIPLNAITNVCRKDIYKMIENEPVDNNVEILDLYFRNNYTPKDIQEVLDIPRGTVLSTITRFVRKVKDRYEDTSSGLGS